MELSSAELRTAMEWLLPLGVCCAEAQADGVPCQELGRSCLECERADAVRRLLLRMAEQIARGGMGAGAGAGMGEAPVS